MGFFDALNAGAGTYFQGQKLLTDLDEQKAQIAQRQAATEGQNIENQIATISMNNKKALADWMQANSMQKDASAATSSDLAQQFLQATKFAADRGDFEGAKTLGALATNQIKDAGDQQTQVMKDRQLNLENLSAAAQNVADNPTEDNHAALFKAALKAGKNPMDIPPPGTPEYDAFVKQATTASMSGKERLAYVEKQREYDQKQAALKEERQARHEEREAQRQDLASYRDASLGLRQDTLNFRKEQAAAKLVTPPKNSSTMERQATAVVNSANEASQGLVRMSEMGAGETAGVFAHLEDPSTILKALTKTGTNKITPEATQMFQSNLSMLGLEVAQAQAAPYKPNKEQISEARRTLEPSQGDTEYTVMYKMALAADILKARMQSAPKVDWLKDAQGNAEKNLARFPTASQVYEAAKAQGVKLGKRKEGATLMDRLHSLGGGDTNAPAAPAAPAYQPSAAQKSLLDQYAPATGR